MMETKNPKVFISYSWAIQESVLELATQLRGHGVDVILDVWDLKEGNDKYAFMEQSVTNPEVKKVLIICDETYANKANGRLGGVGDETVIITPELYGKTNQTKFLPIVMQRDADGNEYLPAYLKGRLYFDLSDPQNVENNYQKLLRNIFQIDTFKKPELGTQPDWLNEKKTNLYPLKATLHKFEASKTSSLPIVIDEFIKRYIDTIRTHYDSCKTEEDFFEAFKKSKSIRDLFVDFLILLCEKEEKPGDFIPQIFENLYNELLWPKTEQKTMVVVVYDNRKDILSVMIWELFIITTSILRKFGKYGDIRQIISYPYLLEDSSLYESGKVYNYCKFRVHSKLIEEKCKPDSDNPKLYSLTADTIITREYYPHITKASIVSTDIFLYQMSQIMDFDYSSETCYSPYYWFPNCYIYSDGQYFPKEWLRLKSRAQCKKLFTLFDVKSMDEFKAKLEKATPDREMKYSGAWEYAPSILNAIKLDEIGIYE